MMLVAADDAQAETTVMSLATDLRFEAVDAGPLAMSRHREPAAASTGNGIPRARTSGDGSEHQNMR